MLGYLPTPHLRAIIHPFAHRRLICQVGLVALGATFSCGLAIAADPEPRTRYEYDAQGNITRIVAAHGSLNLRTSMAYDELGRMVRQVDPAKAAVEFTYNARDAITKVTDPRNLATSYVVDGLDQIAQLRSVDTGRTTYTYNAAGQITSQTDARMVKASFTYDVLDRLTQLKYEQFGITPMPNSLVRNFNYDQTGEEFSYGTGRLTSVEFPSGIRKYAYDPHGRLVRARQSLTYAGRTHQATVRYRYNDSGQLNQIIYPSGRRLNIGLAGGMPGSLSMSLSANGPSIPIVNDIRWAAWSRLEDRTTWLSWNWILPSGIKTHTRDFDEWGRIVGYPLGNYVRGLRYDAADRVVSYLHTQNGASIPSLNQVFDYDSSGRVVRSQVGSKVWSYTYDATGNRTAHSTPTVNTGAYTIAATSNQLIKVDLPSWTFIYTSTGAARQGGDWYASHNLAGEMSSITRGGITTNYEYDTDHRRMVKSDMNSLVAYVYGQQGELLGEYDMISGEAIREYIWLGRTPLAMVAKANGSKQTELFLIHTDHLDTPRVVLDTQDRQRWRWLAEPFGNEPANQAPTPGLPALVQNLRFPGQVHDPESDLFYNHHRFYDPRVGRYTQSDPIGLAGGINTYAYVDGAPTMYADPDGLQRILPGPVPLPIPGPLPGRPNVRPVDPSEPGGPTYRIGPSWPSWPPDGPPGDRSCPPSPPGDKCDKQYKADSEVCRSMPTAEARGRCWKSASDRMAACIAGRGGPPLATWY